LQVGETGHHSLGLGLCQAQQPLLQAGDFAENDVDLVTQPQADIGSYLVVTATSGVQLLAGDADAVGQARFDVHVHVFQVDAPVELAGFDFRLDILEPGDDRVALLGIQHARLLEHGRMGDRAHDVMTVEALVEVDGGGETGDEGVDGLAEAAAPGLVGFLDTHGNALGWCATGRRDARAAGMPTKRCANDSRVGPVAAAVQRCRAHHASLGRHLCSVRQIAADVPGRAETVAMQIQWLNGAPRAPLDDFFVPELCEPEALLSLVLLAELLVLVLVLAEPMLHGFDWVRLALTSLFVQWCVLLSAAVLCRLRPWLARLRPAVAGPLCCLIVVVLTLGCTWVTEYFELGGPPSPEARLYLRHALISLIMSALLLRYFYLQSQWRRQQQAELQARIESLQARIRPHFLFNSLNSIASLVVSDPFKAEQAVLDLADLFRAS